MSKFNPGDRVIYTGTGFNANPSRSGHEGTFVSVRKGYPNHGWVNYDNGDRGSGPNGSCSTMLQNISMLSVAVDETEAYFV